MGLEEANKYGETGIRRLPRHPLPRDVGQEREHVEQAFLTMARQIKERMGATASQNKEKINIGAGQSVQSNSNNGCC